MITCKECGHHFLSIWREHYPGGAETGATVLVWGVGLFFAGLLLFVIGALLSIRVLYLFAVLSALMGLLKLASMPENKRIIMSHGGNKCPECDTSNELHWYD